MVGSDSYPHHKNVIFMKQELWHPVVLHFWIFQLSGMKPFSTLRNQKAYSDHKDILVLIQRPTGTWPRLDEGQCTSFSPCSNPLRSECQCDIMHDDSVFPVVTTIWLEPYQHLCYAWYPLHWKRPQHNAPSGPWPPPVTLSLGFFLCKI